MNIQSNLLFFLLLAALPQFADARICERFSVEEYSQAKNRFVQLQKKFRQGSDKPLAKALHDIIANDEFNESRLSHLCETLSRKSDDSCFTQDIINSAVGKRKLTALHIAAAVGNEQAITWLLERSADVNAKDSFRFSPAHFAALQPNRDILTLLSQNGVNSQLENAFGGTAEHLWTLTHLRANTEQDIDFASDDSVVTKIDGNEFCELTGVTFVEGIKMRPLQVIEDWSIGPQANPLSPKFNFNSNVKAFKAKTGSLYFKPIDATDHNGKKMSLGLGLFAGRDFAEGEIVELYASEWSMKPGDSEYQLDKLDGSRMRGYLPVAADGLPNILTLPFFNALGLASGAFAKATRPIAAGEAIMWDYGGHDIKWTVYKELGEEALNQKLVERSMSSRIELFANHPVHSNDDNEGLLTYVADTPSVYIRLLAEKRMRVADLESIRRHVMSGRLSGDGMMQISESHFSILVQGMLGFSNSRIAAFASRKAREGNVQILFMMLANMHSIKAAQSEAELEKRWIAWQTAFCAEHDKLGRGACHLLREKDEL